MTHTWAHKLVIQNGLDLDYDYCAHCKVEYKPEIDNGECDE